MKWYLSWIKHPITTVPRNTWECMGENNTQKCIYLSPGWSYTQNSKCVRFSLSSCIIMHKKFCPTSFRYFGQKYMGAYGSQKTHILSHNSRTKHYILKIPKDPNSPRRIDTFWCLTWLITPSQTPAKNTWEGMGKHTWHAPILEPYTLITRNLEKAPLAIISNILQKTASKNTDPSDL